MCYTSFEGNIFIDVFNSYFICFVLFYSNINLNTILYKKKFYLFVINKQNRNYA